MTDANKTLAGNDARILTREAILASRVPEKIVEVPAWGGCVRVRGMTVAERTALLEAITGPDGKIDGERATLYAFIHGVVEPKFTAEDVAALRELSAAALDTVTREFITLSGIAPGEMADARKKS